MSDEKDMMLLVEDNEIDRAMTKRLFEDSYEIVEASDGKEALLRIEELEDEIAIVLLDLFMPEMDGYEVLKIINRNDKWRNIPVAVLTAERSVESDEKLLDLRVCHIIHKPIQPDIVKKRISNIVENHHTQQNSIKAYMLQKSLISSRTKSFVCIYHQAQQEMEISEEYREYVSEDFPGIFEKVPFDFTNFVLPKDIEMVNDFFDLESRSQSCKEIRVRFQVDKAQYEWFKITKIFQERLKSGSRDCIILFSNIEDSMDANQKLAFMANNDILTHIPNMRSFSSDVQDLLRDNPREDFLLLTMDIYRFRLVNNLFGYHEGDNVIKYLATKLQESIETYKKKAYCRMSSDIFYAFISANEDADLLISDLQERLHNYPLSFDLKLCVGIYQVEDRLEAVETMVNHSSFARLEAKEMPVQYVMWYNEELKEKEYFEQLVISEMETALEEEQFEVFLQPKCNLITGGIIGSEALVRWNRPGQGYLSPGIFIPIFEQNGFVTRLDLYVYEVVCRMIRGWLDQGLPTYPVSVNISRCDLYNSIFFDLISGIVERYRIPHNLLEFEITESAFIAESALIREFTDKLRKNGFHVLIDDFGSGYSSLNSLKEIMVDTLKIDIKFLPVSKEEERASVILSSVIHMAQKLGMDVIAEGVETKEQMDLLEALGCKMVQGFYCYKPMPIDDYQKKIDRKE